MSDIYLIVSATGSVSSVEPMPTCRLSHRKLIVVCVESGNHRNRIDLKQQLGAGQCHHLYHRAGWKVRAQNFTAGLVDISVIPYICGEDVQRDDIMDCTPGRFDSVLNLPQDETGLRLCIPDADDLAVVIRSGLAGNKYHSARLRDVDERVTPHAAPAARRD